VRKTAFSANKKDLTRHHKILRPLDLRLELYDINFNFMAYIILSTVQLLMHLLTQMGHFPAATGSSRCGSVISENDDLPGLNAELDELSTYIFSLPNVQVCRPSI
jgi:hypothetical protein